MQGQRSVSVKFYVKIRQQRFKGLLLEMLRNLHVFQLDKEVSVKPKKDLKSKRRTYLLVKKCTVDT